MNVPRQEQSAFAIILQDYMSFVLFDLMTYTLSKKVEKLRINYLHTMTIDFLALRISLQFSFEIS